MRKRDCVNSVSKIVDKKTVYNRKQAGLLLTTAVGVAGSIATAILANQQKADTGGNVDTAPATIVGASTAGGTAIAGVVSFFVVGSDTDELMREMSNSSQLIVSHDETYLKACAVVTAANAQVCEDDALTLEKYCRATAVRLPYKI